MYASKRPAFNEALVAAEAAITRNSFRVVNKTASTPSNDLHDYWHPAAYYWPNPKTKDDIPYIERDGERVPGTRLYEPESDRDDRSRLQHLFDDSTLLILAWKASGNAAYTRHVANHLKCWFVRSCYPHEPTHASLSRLPRLKFAPIPY